MASSPTISSSSSGSSSSNQSLNTHLTIPSSFPHKLTKDNYLIWKMAILPSIKSQDLYRFIDGSIECPPQTLTSEVDNTITQNPAWLQWHMQDQLLLSILISSLTESIITHVVKCTTSRELWLTLEKMFTSKSKARTMQIHYQLATLKRAICP
jgi:hypothetical protein